MKFFWLLIDAKVMHLFEINTKLFFFGYPLRTVLRKKFLILMSGGGTILFWKIKGQIR
jgi:hypothetical protein